MEGICITHSCIPLYTVYMQHIVAHSGGMQEWVIQIPSIPILVSVLFPSLHLKYFRIKFLLLVFMRMRTKSHPHPVIIIIYYYYYYYYALQHKTETGGQT